jgi:hypothetical protein
LYEREVEGKGVLGVRALEEERNGGAGGKKQSRCVAGAAGDEGSGSRGIFGIPRLVGRRKLLTSGNREGCLSLTLFILY